MNYLIKHKWKYCDLCEHNVVVCGKCGNNTCNGMYGEVDGIECNMCPSAYELYLHTDYLKQKDQK